MLLSSISMADEISGGTAAQDTAAPAEGSPAQESGGQSAAQAPCSDASGDYGLYMLCPDGSEELLADVSEMRVGMSRTCSMSTKALSRRTGRCSIPAYP